MAVQISKNSFIVFLLFCSFINPVFSSDWEDPQTKSAWKGVWGIKDDNCIYLGMWTTHFLPGRNARLNNINRLIGINYEGIFGATFINSHNDRTYTAGIQRIVYSQKFPHYIQIDAGYRVGAIWGYQNNSPFASLKHTIPGIQKMNPIPFFQLIGNFSWEIVGLQISYCWAVFTAGFFVKF